MILMTFEALVQEVKALSVEQRKQLVVAIFDSLTEALPPAASTSSTREIRAAVEKVVSAETPKDGDDLRPAWIKRP
jgi:hypothetical protein